LTMVYNLKVQSIPDLNKKLKFILALVIVSILAITLTISMLAFKAYSDKDKKLSLNNLFIQLSKFTSTYEHRIISIASQPTFRNLLGADQEIVNDIGFKNPFLYGLKRQIASFTAKFQKNTAFEGSIVYNEYNNPILSQGLTTSPYFITIELCYRDAILSYKKGIPCIGTWTFFINKEKLLRLLSQNHQISTVKGNNIAISNLFHFDSIKLLDKNLPADYYFSIPLNNHLFLYYIFISISLIFFTMFVLLLCVMNIYKRNYFDPLFNIHHHLETNQSISENEYKDSPKEINNLISAVNKALKNRKLEAIENLAHDLKPALKQIEMLSAKISDPIKQKLLNVHTQIFLAIHKLHNENIENIDIKKSILDCINSFYNEYRTKDILHIDFCAKNLFCRVSYSHFIRVISNLVSNALKATSDINKPHVKIKTYSKNHFIFIEVSDNGHGIAKENMSNIFQDNISYSGSSGKGLAYCKKNIESWQGIIDCESTTNRGTQFTVCLPESKAPYDFIDSVYLNNTSRLIIIDDEIAFHETIKTCHSSDTMLVHITTVDDLNHYFETDYSAEDIFIIDYHLTDNLNGIDIIRQYDLLGKAYLMSSAADFIKEHQLDLRNHLPIISKNQLPTLKFINVNRFDSVIVDDDLEILSDALELSQLKNTSLLCLNNFLQLSMIMELLHPDTPVTLDNNIEHTSLTGLQMAEILYKKGFTNIAIQSGENIQPNFKFIKSILNKGEFLYE